VLGAVGCAVIDVSALGAVGCTAVVVSYLAVGLAAVVSYPLVAVLSPRSGAAPISSSDRLWHAAKVAAAARIQRVFMSSLLVATEPCPHWASSPIVRPLRACR